MLCLINAMPGKRCMPPDIAVSLCSGELQIKDRSS